MITTGDSGSPLSDTEMIKIDGNGILWNEPCQMPDYPFKVYEAGGTQFNNNLVICGGRYPRTNECHKLDDSTLSWIEMSSMGVNRYYHGMTSIDRTIFVCGGGGASANELNSCEKFENGRWSDIQPLPTKLYELCMLPINSTSILSIGGYDGSKVSKHSLKII